MLSQKSTTITKSRSNDCLNTIWEKIVAVLFPGKVGISPSIVLKSRFKESVLNTKIQFSGITDQELDVELTFAAENNLDIWINRWIWLAVLQKTLEIAPRGSQRLLLRCAGKAAFLKSRPNHRSIKQIYSKQLLDFCLVNDMKQIIPTIHMGVAGSITDPPRDAELIKFRMCKDGIPLKTMVTKMRNVDQLVIDAKDVLLFDKTYCWSTLRWMVEFKIPQQKINHIMTTVCRTVTAEQANEYFERISQTDPSLFKEIHHTTTTTTTTTKKISPFLTAFSIAELKLSEEKQQEVRGHHPSSPSWRTPEGTSLRIIDNVLRAAFKTHRLEQKYHQSVDLTIIQPCWSTDSFNQIVLAGPFSDVVVETKSTKTKRKLPTDASTIVMTLAIVGCFALSKLYGHYELWFKVNKVFGASPAHVALSLGHFRCIPWEHVNLQVRDLYDNTIFEMLKSTVGFVGSKDEIAIIHQINGFVCSLASFICW